MSSLERVTCPNEEGADRTGQGILKISRWLNRQDLVTYLMCGVKKKDQSVLVTQIFCKYLLSLYYKCGASQVALVVKNPTASARNVRDPGSIPGLGRSPEGRHGNPLQYSCLENPIDGGGWWGTVHKVAKSQTRLNQFSTAQHILDILFHDARHIA